jgi:hypothetical protein
MAVTIPNLVIYKYLTGLINTLKKDIEKNISTPESSRIFKIFDNLTVDDELWYKTASQLLTRPKSHPRGFDIRRGFDKDRAQSPTAHITMGEDSTKMMGIGLSESYYVDNNGLADTQHDQFYTFKTNIIFTSENKTEVEILYEVIKAFVPTLMLCFSADGVHNVRTKGMDLTINADMAPMHVYMRSLSFSGDYQSKTPSLDVVNQTLITEIFAEVKEIIIC